MIDDMITYVRDFFKKHDEYATDLPVRLLFRSRFDHIMRVYRWAERINEKEQGDWNIISIAAVFHDIGKGINKTRPHAAVSAEMCEEYLKEKNFDKNVIKRIVSAVYNHSFKQRTELVLPLEDKILIDADLLDEVGALSVIWNSMSVALAPLPSYKKVYDKSAALLKDISTSDKYFRTNAGRELFYERISFAKEFVDNLGYELGLDNQGK